MKILYFIITFACSICNHNVFAMNEMDSDTAIRIAQSLKHDPEALNLFLSSISIHKQSASPESIHERENLVFGLDDDLIEKAKECIEPSQQVTLTTQDFLGNSINYDAEKIYQIDLTDLTHENLNTVINYFKSNSLYNLRILTLPEDNDTCKTFIHNVFAKERTGIYISLLRIKACNNHANILYDLVNTIQSHFIAYGKIVRDMPQLSGKYDGFCAFLTVECIGAQTTEWMTQENWFKGNILRDVNVFYRNGRTKEDIHLIMSIRT